ncbi:hypothetical protein FQN57_006413 [Myotisia sp. PD_48]|nr:hypothetical protein FQN57_006413 [Myotisia sp. PD_48]
MASDDDQQPLEVRSLVMSLHSTVFNLQSSALATQGTPFAWGLAQVQQEAFVVFDDNAGHRRKSSFVSRDTPRLARRHEETTSGQAACFVHSLLGQNNLGGDKSSTLESNGTLPTANNTEERAVVQSRLLTKRELSDMAWNVRALSKKLGSINLKLNVKSIFILTKPQDQCVVRLAREVVRWLLEHERQYIIYVERRLENSEEFDAKSLLTGSRGAGKALKYWDQSRIHDENHPIDLVITLGGDGTVLYASWMFQRVVPPVISFSLGTLGFLTKFDFDSYQETLQRSFNDGVSVRLRLRFECTVMRSKRRLQDESNIERDLCEELIKNESEDSITHTPGQMFQILNEIVVDRGPNPTMSSLEIFGDNDHFTTVQADGVCVATPTGSTAYNLAAGGSLCHPDNPVILLTAICAHTLNFRPIILPDTIVLRIGVPYDARTSSWASFDGRERIELNPGDYVTISASRYPYANVIPATQRRHEWIQSISRTFNWNTRHRQQKSVQAELNEELVY